MAILWTIVIGFVVGLVARFLMPGKDPKGLVITTIIGIGGAFLGTLIGQTLGLYVVGQPGGFVMSVIGAMLLLFIYHAVSRNKGGV